MNAQDVGARAMDGEAGNRRGTMVRCDDPDHCITCSDEGVPMRVVSYDASGLAWCVDESGEPAEVMTGLVGDVSVGDLVLVHAGTALTRLEPPNETDTIGSTA